MVSHVCTMTGKQKNQKQIIKAKKMSHFKTLKNVALRTKIFVTQNFLREIYILTLKN